jgi:N-hydroxyarylamine O-acetyltransferase
VQLEPYLKRLGIEKIKNPSFEFLTELQIRHLLSIPFEDLDIPNKRIELDLNKIYNKIIPTKRGGFCYELNGLFHWLLTSLGFKVDMLSARVFNSGRKDFGKEFDHMTLLVHLPNGETDKDYIVDAGFGDSFRIPIEIPGGEVHDVSGHYRILQTQRDIFELNRKDGNNEEPQYCFSILPRQLIDYKDMCDFQQDSPTSHFRTRMLCTIATETGRITLSNDSLTITEGASKVKTSIESKEEFNFMLKKYFNIVL